MVIQIILDTNFLIYCAENKIDYASEIDGLMQEGFEFVVPSQVNSELEKLSKTAKKYTTKKAASLALKLFVVNNVKSLAVDARYADEAILKLARKNGGIVATIDGNLKKKLGRLTRGITIEGKRKLAFD
jgi:rRNA-processing protein FCF1